MTSAHGQHRGGTARAVAGERGFSLIELLVVSAILAILAAITIPVYLAQRERARAVELQSAVTNTALAVESEAAGSDGVYVGGNGAFADEAAFDAYVALALAELQGTGGGPVTYTATDGTGNRVGFRICMEHELLVDAGSPTMSVSYDSRGGGVQDPVELPC